MKLHNRAMCGRCGLELISEYGGHFVQCPCGDSYIDTDRWDCMGMRLGGFAKYEPTLETIIARILLKMCVVVGANFYKLDTSRKDWFFEYEWTQEQQDDFIDFVADYLYKNKIALRLLTNSPLYGKKRCRKVASEFIFNYGWKLKN